MTRYPIGRKGNRKVVVEPDFCRPQADAAKKIGNFIHKIHNNYDPFGDVPKDFLILILISCRRRYLSVPVWLPPYAF